MTAAHRLSGAALVLFVAACGSGSSTSSGSSTTSRSSSSTSTSSTPSDTPSPSASPAGTPASTPVPATATPGGGGPGVSLYWLVSTSSGTQLRRASLAGGGASSVVSVPTDSFVLTVGFGHAVVARPSGVLQVLSLSSGAVTATGHYTGNQPLGAAMSPDGNRVAFLDGDLGSPRVEVMTTASGAVSTLATGGSGAAPSPTQWGADAIGAVSIVPSSDAGPQGAESLSPGSGATAATTTTPGAGSVLVSSDGHHGADATHTDLGDGGDAAGGPGPQGPFNTLQTFTIGSAPTTVYKAAHHNLGLLASLPEGDRLVVSDSPSAGGFAGISMSPDFGLFVQAGSTRTQYLHWDGADYRGGAFLQDGSSIVVSRHDGSAATLVRVTSTGSTTTLDGVAGATAGAVWLVPGG